MTAHKAIEDLARALEAAWNRHDAHALAEPFAEDADFTTGELWGNFPQTYSMVGLINSAVRLSRSWEEAF